MQTSFLLILLSAFAGAVHVLAPDHWIPASIFTWQRRWRTSTSLVFSAMVLSLHVMLGVALYFAVDQWLRQLPQSYLFPIAMIFVFGVMILRGFRFSKIHDIQRLGPHNVWGGLSVLSLLGPCESIVPIFLKASSLGMGYFLPLVSFMAGTVVTGCLLVMSGRFVWNRPFWLMRAFDWMNARVAVLPVAAGVTIGLRFLLRLG